MPSFEPGERVRVNDGVFMHFPGTVEAIDNERRMLTVGLTLFSRKLTIDLRFTQVQKIA